MILKKLSDFIIIDDIRQNAEASELYFLSHLMGNEMLTLPDNWPARIYTSKFIFDVINKKKPYVKMHFFRTLQPNVPVKFRSKEKTIMATMFETGEITHNVMFYFEDGSTTHLYTGVFTEVCRLNFNKDFKQVLGKGIDYVYIDTTRCKSKSFLFADDTVEEISQLYTSNQNRSIALIIPDFGYEAILVELLEKLPHKVYPTSNQRKMLARLGYGQLVGNLTESPIKIYSPGITVDFIESNNLLTIYVAEGKPSLTACEIEICQWSPLPSAMHIQELLEITRPKNIIPIKRFPMEDNVSLRASFKLFLSSNADVAATNANSMSAVDSSLESLSCADSNASNDSDYDPAPDDMSDSKPINSSQKPRQSKERANDSIHQSFAISPQSTDSERSTKAKKKGQFYPKNRVREIPRPQEIEYEDSD